MQESETWSLTQQCAEAASARACYCIHGSLMLYAANYYLRVVDDVYSYWTFNHHEELHRSDDKIYLLFMMPVIALQIHRIQKITRRFIFK